MNPMLQYLPQNNPISILKSLKENPQAVWNEFMRNPQFAEFARKAQGKSPDQVAKEYGIDIDAVKKLIGG